MDRLEKVEEAVLLLTKLSEPGPRSVWDKLCLDRVRDLLWVLTIPTLLYTGVVNFDRYWLSRSDIQNEEKRGLRGFVWVIFSDKLLKVSA